MVPLAVSFAHWLSQLPHPWGGLGYQIWSGAGSDIGEITLVGAVLAGWKHRNCQVKWCPLIHLSKPTAAGHYVCKLHHPEHTNKNHSHAEILAAHEAANGDPDNRS